MPAINVARTDTFEKQRLKINEIGSQIFNVTAGGSDLATGNLKLGNGSRIAPSLSFTNDAQVGIYRPSGGTLGLVGGAKNIIDFSNEDIFSYRNISFRKKVLSDANLTLTSSGLNYDFGTYNNISVVGGSGDLGTLDIEVVAYSGTITNTGQNYNPGSFSNVSLAGGNGTNATVDFTVDAIDGSITSNGSQYAPGQYQNVNLQNGTGSSATANITITGEETISGSISNAGSLYANNIYNGVAIRNDATAVYVLSSVANPGSPPPNNVYQINGITQQALTLIKGNTYRFDISDSSLSTHPLQFLTAGGAALDFQSYVVNKVGTEGTAESFIDLIISPNAPSEALKYDCQNHPNMGATMTVGTGSAGVSGSGMTANFEVVGGAIQNFAIASQGNGYKVNDSLTVAAFDLGGTGSGFLYNINSITYTGTVTDVSIISSGQNYVLGDVLTANDSDLGNGGGSGFEYTVNTSPGIIKDLTFVDRGTNYQTNDVLTLQTGLSGITGDFIVPITGVSATTDGSTTVTVASTVGIYSGMVITVSAGPGDLAPNTTVDTILNSTSFTVSQNSVASGSLTLDFATSGSSDEVIVSSIAGISVGDIPTVSSGVGVLPANTTITNINELGSSITLSNTPTSGGPVTLTISPAYGVGTTPFAYQILNLGAVSTVSVNNPGNGYNQGDLLSVSPTDLIQPTTYSVKSPTVQTLTFSGSVSTSLLSVGDILDYDDGTFVSSFEIINITASGPNISDVTVIGETLQPSNILVKQGTSSPQLTINTVSNGFRFLIDTGGGFTLTPDLTLYVGNTYAFDLSDSTNSSHSFAFSKFRDGIHSPSKIENISTSLVSGSRVITVASTTGILAGMELEKISGDGEFLIGTVVESVDSGTQITLSQNPTSAGAIILTFAGTEYTDGVVRTSNLLTLKITEGTPSPLYYFCNNSGATHTNMGGEDNTEAEITIDPNNPKTFGSGFQLSVDNSSSTDTVKIDILSGIINTNDIVSSTGTIQTINSTTLTTNTAGVDTLTVSNIASASSLNVTAVTEFSQNVLVGSNLEITATNGNITTNGTLRSNASVNVSGKLAINNSTISSIGTNDLILSPAGGKLVKVDTTTSLLIPVGTSLERPTFTTGEGDGAIRFNTVSGQYEGYNATTQSWSSLGGVRDIDGNTYILAELTAGSNDNILYFYNDNNNTLQLTTNQLRFESVKELASPRLGIPAYTEWTANTPVTTGQYLKYRNNLYEVTSDGSTGTSGSEPIHVSGTQNNGTAQLNWSQIAVSPIIFNEAEEVRVGPNKDCPLIVNSEIKISSNEISSLVENLVFKPNSGKQTIVDSNTHFRIPAGDNNAKNLAPAGPGSIRFNTEILQFEGYSGNNWSSLGGVRDVDGNTYIIPETAPAANENILYFYNNNVNTLQLSVSSLDFTNIDTITTGGNSLELSAEIVTLNAGDTTVDNTSADRTFISSTKQYLDFGLSSGLNVDPILRLDDQGDVFLNTTFGSGSFNGVKVLDGALKEFELADYKISTATFALIKGGSESSSVILYPSGSSKGCKITVVSKSASGKRSMTEYSVIDNGTDIFHNEYASLNTSADQYTSVFDLTAATEPRITLSLSDDHDTGDIVNFTVLIQEIK
jgi:hypothetical protein